MASSGGSGKDTVADILLAYLASYDRHSKKYALAEGIYDVCYSILGNEDDIKRSHLQGVGESLRNVFGKDVWINDTDKRIKSDQQFLDDVIDYDDDDPEDEDLDVDEEDTNEDDYSDDDTDDDYGDEDSDYDEDNDDTDDVLPDGIEGQLSQLNDDDDDDEDN